MRRELDKMTKHFETNTKNRPIQSKYTENGPKSLENPRDNEPPTEVTVDILQRSLDNSVLKLHIFGRFWGKS